MLSVILKNIVIKPGEVVYTSLPPIQRERLVGFQFEANQGKKRMRPIAPYLWRP
jgi:hypothetical protein